MKTCPRCKKSFSLKNLKNFYRWTPSSSTYCRPCRTVVNLEYKSKNKERIAQDNNKYINTEKGYTKETINSIFQRAKEQKSNRTRKKWIPECTQPEIFAELELYIQEHGRICEYCKKPWTYIRKMGTIGEGFKKRTDTIFTNFSIDRLDSTKTYVLTNPALNQVSNLVFCCIGCNNRKNQVTLSDIDNIKRVWGERHEVE